MGVHGLWELLAPVGRRVSVETLAGKKLAIDASIWMVQFMKAMRDEKGDMVRHAHLLGFFRRICKLLFLRTKPVFVFDGGTPALKRRTVIARRRQRESAQAKIRKTAEKLLLNQLKAMKLKELAMELQNQKEKNDARGKGVLSDQIDMTLSNSEKNDVVLRSYNQEKLDELLAASIAAEEDGGLAKNAATSAATIPYDDDDEAMILLEEEKLKELAKSIKNQKQNNDAPDKGKKVLVHETNLMERNSESNDVLSRTYNQEELDEMLSASIAAEEDGNIINNISSSATEDDEDEEMLLPAMHGKVDPAVLAALPPSMQLDLLVQMREKLMAENRQKYQKVKKAPGKFSELQIQSYLKTVAFRREIDEVQKSAAGRGVGGVQISRIASEANREFIFSSSFTGDKQALTSTEADRSGDKEQQTSRVHPSSDSVDRVVSTHNSDNATGLVPNEPGSVFDDNVETYLDERGRVRVSRVKAMGIRMTRDLQRNLDLMKEIDKERTSAFKIADAESTFSRNKIHVSSKKTVDEVDDESVNLNERNERSMLKNETTIEISFEDKGEDNLSDDDDDIFAQLVTGDPVIISRADNTPSIKQSTDSASDSDWEEGMVEGKGNSFFNDGKVDNEPFRNKGCISDECDMGGEKGDCDVLNSTSSCPPESGKSVSRGSLEEEADLQEAIKRSLEDLRGEKSIHASFEGENVRSSGEKAYEELGFLHPENNKVETNMIGKNVTQQNESFCELVDKPDNTGGMNISQTICYPVAQLNSSVAYNPDKMEIPLNKPCERYQGSCSEQSMKDASEKGSLYREIRSTKESHLILEQPVDTSTEGGGLPTFAKRCLRDNPSISDPSVGDLPDAVQVDDKRCDSGAEPSHHLVETTNHATLVVESSSKGLMKDVEHEQNLNADVNHDNFLKEREHEVRKFAINDNEKVQVEDTVASLEEEILILGEECMNLGSEQRKLERNAESVSSEMFAECQDLLQMFGLPYIIAPMEAEAQCAYMELANLVDGVVTDDSDVFLFGARSVYKNIFDDRKYVETYFMKDVENELGLSREKLTHMALLLGSDYTEGVSGIGIVNAIEVVNAFPEEDGLRKFREWIESPDPTILEKFDVKTGSSSRKRGSKVHDSNLNHAKSQMEENVSQAHEHEKSVDYVQDIKQIFMDKHRNVSKNWHVPDSFPSESVISAYASPQVDKSTEPFSWGKPDHLVLRKLCWEKFGWGNQKADELLLPVLKEYNKHETQLRLEAFYTFNERFAKIRSKRIKKAVKGITRNKSLELMDDTVQEIPKSRKKKKVSPSEPGDERSETHSKGTEEGLAGNDNNPTERSNRAKQSREKRICGEPVFSQMENPELSVQMKVRQTTNKKSSGSGRGRGRGRSHAAGRGRRKLSPDFELLELSSSDGHSSDDHFEVRVEKLEGPQEVRRSTRSRRPVKYNLNDLENEGTDKSLDLSDKEWSNVEVVVKESSFQGIAGDPALVLDEKKQNKADLAVEGSHNDYLEMEGDFFMSQGEISEVGVSQRGDPSSVAESSEDCLKMGGGFCGDEGETLKDEVNACNPATATISEVAETSHNCGFTGEAECDIGSVQLISSPKRGFNRLQNGEKADDIEQSRSSPNAINEGSKVVVSPQENREDDAGAISAGALSAMPFLRRKRRKT